MAADPGSRVFEALDRLAGTATTLGLALSGGGDSTALMHLAADWARGRAPRVALKAATVDHRLRPESGGEAAAAAAAAGRLGIPHATLVWEDGPEPSGNLAAQARGARLRLLGDWAARERLDAVLLGHTRDDVAETMLMRLGRGAGIDGLAAMAERREAAGAVWLRPLLGTGRAELRDWLAAFGIAWIEDPTNEDVTRDRARIRRAVATLGLDPARIADSARHLATVRRTLGRIVWQEARTATVTLGAVAIDRARFDGLLPELRRVLLLALVRTVMAGGYPPRHAAQGAALDALARGGRATLGGTLVTLSERELSVIREPAAAERAAPLTADGVWDGRWRIEDLPPGCEIRAFGLENAARLQGRRPATELAATTPGLWRGGSPVGGPGLSGLPPEAGGARATPLCSPELLRRLLLGD